MRDFVQAVLSLEGENPDSPQACFTRQARAAHVELQAFCAGVLLLQKPPIEAQLH